VTPTCCRRLPPLGIPSAQGFGVTGQASPPTGTTTAPAGSPAQQPVYEEFVTVACCALGKLCFVWDALNVHVRAARTHASGQDLPTTGGGAFRQLATPGTASPQAAIAAIIKRGNIDAWQMRAPAWSCRRTLQPPIARRPGRR